MTTDMERIAVTVNVLQAIDSLLEAHWREIRDIADTPNDKGEAGEITVTIKLDLDFTGKAPAGAVNIAIPPRTIKDGAAFTVADPAQPEFSTLDRDGDPVPKAVVDALRTISGAKKAK